MGEFKYLSDVLILLAVSMVAVVSFRRFKLSPVLGYLIVGAAIGDHGFNILNDTHYTHDIAEFGVIFLLFVIGLELTIDRIWKMRKYVFGYGGAQVLCTTVILFFLLTHYANESYSILMLVAISMAFSSTAVVLQILSENKRQDSQVGRLSLAILLMQDLAVVPVFTVLALMSSFTENLGAHIMMSAFHACVAMMSIVIIGRLLLRPFFSLIGSAKTDEAFVSTALLIVLGSSLITEKMGLTGEMGAFMSGMMIAETEYRSKVEKSVLPFKNLLLGLFFLSVGMNLDVKFILAHMAEILLIALCLLVVKFSIIFTLFRSFSFMTGISIHLALLLAQGGEFAFIVFSMVEKQKLLNGHLSQMLLTSITITMAVTPLLSMVGTWAESYFDIMAEKGANEEFSGVRDLNSHVVIVGFGNVGRIVSYILSHEGIGYVAVDASVVVAKRARKEGLQVYHGDIGKKDIMRAVALKRARAVIITVDDKSYIRRAVREISNTYPHLDIISKVDDYRNGQQLRKLGVTVAIPSKVEAGLDLGDAFLRNIGMQESRILELKQNLRENNYYMIEELGLLKGDKMKFRKVIQEE